LHDLKEEVLKNQRRLESFRPESRGQVRLGVGGEHAGLGWGLLFFSLIASLSVQ
jgi:hypothetical protein